MSCHFEVYFLEGQRQSQPTKLRGFSAESAGAAVVPYNELLEAAHDLYPVDLYRPGISGGGHRME